MRARTGRGRDVDTNLYDSALAMLSYPGDLVPVAGFVTERQPMSAHPTVVPFQFFATADGHLAIAAPKEKFFRSLVAAMDLPELGADRAVRGLRVARAASRGAARHPHPAVRRRDDGGLARAAARPGAGRARSIVDAGAGPR